ncbi:hypothetical protein vBCtySFA67_00021 [Clostridium phage vB_CtyS-FA67]|nr:hypothetical protein vBCtySFA67_00021 [Clostridium phage vB_CtyS-FA67]
MLLNYSALLDLKGNSSLDNIRCVIGDGNVYRLNVLVALSGQIVDLTGHTARITFVKPDGHVVWQNMTIDDATSGSMYCVFENQVYAVEGIVQAEIELYDNGTNRLTTATFTLTARRGLLDDSAVESSSEFTALDDALEAVQGFDSIKSEIVTARGGYASLGARLTALDNIQIGGRNLIPNSVGDLGSWTNTVQEIVGDIKSLRIDNSNSDEITAGSPRFSIKPNTEYIITFWAKTTTNCKNVEVFWLSRKSGSSADFDCINLLLSAKKSDSVFTKYVATYTTKSDEAEGYIRFDNNGSSDGQLSSAWVGLAKFEAGNKATDWTPAPEDITAYVDSRSIPFLGTTTNTGNNYNIVTPNYSAVDGRSFTIRFNADSTGAVQISFNSGGLVPIYRYDGTQVDNIKAGSVVHLIWSLVSGVFKLYIS